MTPQGGENPYDGTGRFAVESYLDHHGEKLVGRFDANSYVVLTKAMNSHDVGRGRGGCHQARWTPVTAQTVVAAIDSDRLYPVELSELHGRRRSRRPATSTSSSRCTGTTGS